jgi:hypothetical protein
MTVRLDPRLADPQLLALAAIRVKQRQASPQVRYITWAEYEWDLDKQPGGITLPVKLTEAEWTKQMQIIFGYAMEHAPESYGL